MKKHTNVVFQGGLGNQLFQYLYIKKLEENGINVTYINNVGNAHNGFELLNYFNVNISKSTLIDLLFFKVLRNLRLLRFHCFISDENNCNNNKIFQIGYWQDVKFFPSKVNLLFKIPLQGELNIAIANQIKNSNSVFLHVRRGDYLLPPHNKRFEGICTKDYYQKAIKIIMQKIENPTFFLFSNDMEWVKENLIIDSAKYVYVNWNKGKNSIYDMYLMSLCKAGILANSTFSYWGAFIGQNKYVIYPKKWFNDLEAPKIFPKTWLSIE